MPSERPPVDRRTLDLGAKGEDLAVAWYTRRGYEVLGRNWRCRDGELDLVVSRDRCVVFCEVKTRRSSRFGSPVEAVTPAKAARLRRLAGQWLRAHDLPVPHIRVDVIGVLVPRSGPVDLVHLEGVA